MVTTTWGAVGKGCSSRKIESPWAEEVAQLVDYLPCKHEDLNYVLRTRLEELGVVTRAYNPGAGEAGQGQPWDSVARQHSSSTRPRLSEWLGLRRNKVEGPGGTITKLNLWPPRAHKHTWPAYTLTYMHAQWNKKERKASVGAAPDSFAAVYPKDTVDTACFHLSILLFSSLLIQVGSLPYRSEHCDLHHPLISTLPIQGPWVSLIVLCSELLSQFSLHLLRYSIKEETTLNLGVVAAGCLSCFPQNGRSQEG